MRTAFGLDLAGYSSGRSGFARARYDGGVIDVTVYRGTVFGRPLAGIAPLPEHAAEERALLHACCERGLVFVDIPIDLQGLPTPSDVRFPWQLVKRPVDFAFGALAPLADRIGAPVARFRHILAPLLTESADLLGRRLFETYPAATLELLNHPRRGYKGLRGREALATLGRDLRISHAEDETLSDDELDASICAITGVVDDQARLQGDDLDAEITRRMRDKMLTRETKGIPTAPPTGYVLQRVQPEATIRLTVRRLRHHAELLSEVAR
jgi:hypothetical protein